MSKRAGVETYASDSNDVWRALTLLPTLHAHTCSPPLAPLHEHEHTDINPVNHGWRLKPRLEALAHRTLVRADAAPSVLTGGCLEAQRRECVH